jgi:hypothetical protein
MCRGPASELTASKDVLFAIADEALLIELVDVI